ncbi:MAG TPA: FAD-dependent oxidoreductase [Bauldia sp.]|nr:FAD-dependent oxidoreductase [Bauldia sp.]
MDTFTREEHVGSDSGWSSEFLEEGAAVGQAIAHGLGRRSRAPITAGAPRAERTDVIVIGGGQAGLSAGYHLKQRGLSFVILDAADRVGDVWRQRWDSLRLFTPARFDGLDGMPFPAPATYFPTKDEMADYLEAYAARFALPVRSGVRVDRLSKSGELFVAEAGGRRYEAGQVIIAMSKYQKPFVPGFAGMLDPAIVQLHSLDYRNPDQLRDGSVLLVGAANSASEIARDLAPARKVFLSGRHPGHVPVRIDSFLARHVIIPFLFRVVFHRILTVNTPMGRKARHRVESGGAPLIRVKPKDLDAIGVVRVPRVAGVRDGRPLLDDGRALDVANLIWCTGFTPGLDWVELPIFDDEGHVVHRRGATSVPGVYVLGLGFLYSFSSMMIQGVGRDAAFIADRVVEGSALRVPA